MAAEAANTFMLQYTFEKSLGELLTLVRNKTGQLKVVKKHKIIFTEHIVASVDALVKSLQHSCVVNTDVSFVEPGGIYLVSTYCEGGSMSALIKRAREYDEILNEFEVADWLIHITLGLQHLHSKGLVYGHLNPKELEKLEQTRTCDGDCCTKTVTIHNAVPFLSPRLLMASTGSLLPSPADDMWALGCCLYEMCSRRKLFTTRLSQKVFIESEDIILPQYPEQFSAQLAEVWHRLMEKDDTKRPSATELLEMDYLTLHRQCLQTNPITSHYLQTKMKESAEAGLLSCVENDSCSTSDSLSAEQYSRFCSREQERELVLTASQNSEDRWHLFGSVVDHGNIASDDEELDNDDTFLTSDDIDELLKSPST